MVRLSDPEPAPNGERVVWAARTFDAATNGSSSNLWLGSLDGAPPRRLTQAAARDGAPRWLSDGGTVLFLSNRGGSSQIWAIDPVAGEPWRVSDLPIDVDSFRVTPDGQAIVFSAEVFPDCADVACTATRQKEKDGNVVKARVYTELLFRHWDTWEDGRRSHLFVAPLQREGKRPTGLGPARDLMPGLDADVPTKPFGGAEDYALAPDGTEIAFAMRSAGAAAAWSTDLDLYVVPTYGSAPPRRLTTTNRAVDTAPAYSPDGRWLAWLAMARPGYEADRQRIVLLDRGASRPRTPADDAGRRILTEAWDRSVASLTWSPDGLALWVTAEETGRLKIFAVDAASGAPHVIVDRHHNTAVAAAGRGRLVFLQDSMTSPADLFTIGVDRTGLRRLTEVNRETLAGLRLEAPEEFWFTGAHGDRVHGWILPPTGFDPSRRYPVALLIHGGPQGAYMDQFHYRWNPQIYAGAGYATVAINFHGSTGYGQAFTDAIRGDWGGAPYQDLMLGLDHMLKARTWADGERVAALGASYGGYMVNWIAGQTDRFRCLVNHDGGFDEHASYYTTEELWFPEWEFRGTPWEKPELYDKFSPSRYVDRWKTPMLVIHGGRDYRVPEGEGFATFTALRRRGIPARLLHFPDENHWVLKPANALLWHKTVLDWLKEWLGD